MIFDEKRPSEVQEDKPILSIVIPAYNEEGNLRKIYSELMDVLPSIDMTWEIIFADDGSTDKTWDIILALHHEDKSIKGIRLSRNFGHQYALLAGLVYAEGEAIVTLDADLQHPPHIIPELIKEWQKGSKIVHTIRSDPDDFSFFKKTTSQIFYKVFSFLSGVKIESGMADFRLLDRQVLDALLQFRENGLFLRGLVQWIGFSSSVVRFNSANRFSGNSHYTIKKMATFGWHGISSFSLVPLRIGILVGILTSGLAFSWLIYALYAKLIEGTTVPGWTSSVSILSFLFGILFILLGLVGEYVGRVLIEVKQRPRFLISDQIGPEVGSTEVSRSITSH